MSSISLSRYTKELPQEAVEGEVTYPLLNPSFFIIIYSSNTTVSETFQNFSLK